MTFYVQYLTAPVNFSTQNVTRCIFEKLVYGSGSQNPELTQACACGRRAALAAVAIGVLSIGMLSIGKLALGHGHNNMQPYNDLRLPKLKTVAFLLNSVIFRT